MKSYLWIPIFAVAGCSSSQAPAIPEIRVPADAEHLRILATSFTKHVEEHKGRPPANEGELKAWVARTNPELSFEQIIRSPRDGETYVVFYRPLLYKQGPGAPPPVVAHERTGVAGKRYVVFPHGAVEEVDAKRFQELMPDKSMLKTLNEMEKLLRPKGKSNPTSEPESKGRR